MSRSEGRAGAPRVAGIVLAGGLSRRFGLDKLAAPYQGGTLLDAAILSVAAVCDEILVVLPPDGPAPALTDGVSVRVRFVRDVEAAGGPLAALPEALRATIAPFALVVAGDTPRLPVGIARLLLVALAAPGPPRPGPTVGRASSRVAAAALLEGDRFRPLPLALRPAPAALMADRLLAAGERRLRALLEALGATAVPEAAWRREDPAGDALRDIDTPEDLAELT